MKYSFCSLYFWVVVSVVILIVTWSQVAAMHGDKGHSFGSSLESIFKRRDGMGGWGGGGGSGGGWGWGGHNHGGGVGGYDLGALGLGLLALAALGGALLAFLFVPRPVPTTPGRRLLMHEAKRKGSGLLDEFMDKLPSNLGNIIDKTSSSSKDKEFLKKSKVLNVTATMF